MQFVLGRKPIFKNISFNRKVSKSLGKKSLFPFALKFLKYVFGFHIEILFNQVKWGKEKEDPVVTFLFFTLLVKFPRPIQPVFGETFIFFYYFFLLVVSQLWGKQCVRLKVVVKSDNCGENADCSNKGVCFSNISMVSDFIFFLLEEKRLKENRVFVFPFFPRQNLPDLFLIKQPRFPTNHRVRLKEKHENRFRYH